MAFIETHTPGAYTPRAGLYECDCAGGTSGGSTWPVISSLRSHLVVPRSAGGRKRAAP